MSGQTVPYITVTHKHSAAGSRKDTLTNFSPRMWKTHLTPSSAKRGGGKESRGEKKTEGRVEEQNGKSSLESVGQI